MVKLEAAMVSPQNRVQGCQMKSTVQRVTSVRHRRIPFCACSGNKSKPDCMTARISPDKVRVQ
jgi:hypothetical protein